MATRARNTIIQSFVRLLEERPVNKITVKDIAEDCGVNRNTFYYYFADIPSLAEALLKEEAESFADSVPGFRSMEECVEAFTRTCKDRRRTIGHLYRYISREVYERHLFEICERFADAYVGNRPGARRLSPEDRSAIVEGYKCELYGFVTDWLRQGMSEDMEREFLRLCALREGMIDLMVDRAAPGKRP